MPFLILFQNRSSALPPITAMLALSAAVALSAITAVVVGGTPLTGGRVRILGTLAGAMLMQLISATLITHNLPDSGTRMVQAAIILGAVFIQRQRSGL